LNYKIYKIFLILFFIFNLTDTFATFYFVVERGAKELNPLMEFLINIHPWVFVSVKIIFSIFVLLLFWNHLHNRMARVATIIAFSAYSLIFLYYVIGLSYIWVTNGL
jgi:hypothetical protein